MSRKSAPRRGFGYRPDRPMLKDKRLAGSAEEGPAEVGRRSEATSPSVLSQGATSSCVARLGSGPPHLATSSTVARTRGSARGCSSTTTRARTTRTRPTIRALTLHVRQGRDALRPLRRVDWPFSAEDQRAPAVEGVPSRVRSRRVPEVLPHRQGRPRRRPARHRERQAGRVRDGRRAGVAWPTTGPCRSTGWTARPSAVMRCASRATTRTRSRSSTRGGRLARRRASLG